jgi:hypothetical protein
MAKTTKLAPSKKQFKPKPITKGPAKAALNVIGFVKDVTVPTSALDVALLPFARPIKSARVVGGIVGKGAKAVTKAYRNMGK